MLIAYKTSLYFILAILTFGVIHSGTSAAASLSHAETKSSAQNSSACQPICHGSPAANRTKLVDIEKDEQEPIPPLFALDESAPITPLENLITDRQIWKLSSWTPPDRLLLASAYSTSL
jgi:hypothetical protein